jgi:hypothetical protein
MNPIIEISLSTLAWFITLIRIQTVIRNRLWKSDPIAFRVWQATLFFALTTTFLVTPVSDVINRLMFPNLSRLLAYSSVAMTLYLTASSFLVTFPTQLNLRQAKLLKPYLIITLFSLSLVYILFVSRSSEWVEQPIPGSAGEMIFKLVIFTYATLLCFIMAFACYRYLNQEQVAVTKYRIIAIILTGASGGVFFFTKTVLSLSYLWGPLGADWIHLLSKVLQVGTAMLWGGSFLHSNVYVRVLAIFRGVRYWPIYQDLLALVENLERLCPPVGMSMDKPGFWQFVRNSDYHLYRAIVNILDGKTLIADFLDDTIPLDQLRARWTQTSYLEAVRLNTALNAINSSEDYLDLISAYRLASRRLRESMS